MTPNARTTRLFNETLSLVNGALRSGHVVVERGPLLLGETAHRQHQLSASTGDSHFQASPLLVARPRRGSQQLHLARVVQLVRLLRVHATHLALLLIALGKHALLGALHVSPLHHAHLHVHANHSMLLVLRHNTHALPLARKRVHAQQLPLLGFSAVHAQHHRLVALLDNHTAQLADAVQQSHFVGVVGAQLAFAQHAGVAEKNAAL